MSLQEVWSRLAEQANNNSWEVDVHARARGTCRKPGGEAGIQGGREWTPLANPTAHPDVFPGIYMACTRPRRMYQNDLKLEFFQQHIYLTRAVSLDGLQVPEQPVELLALALLLCFTWADDADPISMFSPAAASGWYGALATSSRSRG